MINDAFVQPMLERFPHLSPRALAKLAITCRTWRDAARGAEFMCEVTELTSMNDADLWGSQGAEIYGGFYGASPSAAAARFPRCAVEISWVYEEEDLIDKPTGTEPGSAGNFYAITAYLRCPALVEVAPDIRRFLEPNVYPPGEEPEDQWSNLPRQLIGIGEGAFMFDATANMRHECAFAARLPRAFDFLPAAVIRQVAQHMSDNYDLPDDDGWKGNVDVGWAFPVLGRECDWTNSRERLENHLRITYFCAPVYDVAPVYDDAPSDDSSEESGSLDESGDGSGSGGSGSSEGS